MSKYHAVKTTVDGIKFDSIAESVRYRHLLILKRVGSIKDLAVQVPYVLVPSVKLAGEKRAKPAMRYLADFVYHDCRTGEIVVEDVKGVVTPLFRAKQHLMKHIHNIDVRVTK